MQNQELARQLQRLSNLFKRSSDIAAVDLELQSHWAKYLCVLCSGFLENSIPELYGDYVRRNSGKPVGDFVSRELNSIRSPKGQRFIEIAGQFKKEWGKDLETFIEIDERKVAIDAITNIRHKIAHGEDSNITILRLQEFFQKAVEVVEFVEQQLR